MALRTKKSRSNSVSWLGDDEVALILKRITHPDDRKSFSEVCKQWCRVEGLNRSSIRLLQLDFLLRVLPRFPNLVTFETSKCITRNDDLEFLFQTCPKIKAINLGKPAGDDVIEPWDYGSEVLYALTYSCPKLSKVSLRRRDYIGGAIPLIKAQNNFRHLDLGHCSCVFDKVLEAIGSLSLLSYLNLECCDRITDSGLGFLANGSCSKTLKTLVLAGCSGITDLGVCHLQNMSCLEELDLDGVKRVSDDGLIAVSEIPTLKKVNLGWITVWDESLDAIRGGFI